MEFYQFKYLQEYLKEVIRKSYSENPDTTIIVDLENQVLKTPIGNTDFEINPYKKLCMT